MTPESVNQAIAESLGWRQSPIGDTRKLGWVNPEDRAQVSRPAHELPNFFSSLDACASFEKTLNRLDQLQYETMLKQAVQGVSDFPPIDFELITATAPQRCEAFLKVRGLWEEEE